MAPGNQLNFLPEDYLERRRQQRTNILCLLLFAVVMAGLVGAFVTDERRLARAASDRERVNRQLETVARQLAQIEEMQQRKEKMIHKAEITASLLERRPRHYLVAAVTNSLPTGASLVSIELSGKEVKLKQATPAGTAEAAKSARTSRAARPAGSAGVEQQDRSVLIETVRVMGMAPDDKVVSRFIGALDSLEVFRKVELVFSEEHTYQEQQLRRFLLQIELNNQMQVTEDMIKAQRFKPGAFK